MSVSSQVSRLQFTITSLTGTFSLSPMQFNLASDLIVSDGAVVLVLNSDYTVAGGGYNSSNQLQSGSITLTNTGANAALISINDSLTVGRNVPATQATSFDSTGLLTPLMIEQDDDKLTLLAQELLTDIYNPFPPVYGSGIELTLGWIKAESGGLPGCIDALNVVNIPLSQIPLFIGVSISDVYTKWKLRAMQMGDPSVTTLPNYIVPVTNPNNLIWVSQ